MKKPLLMHLLQVFRLVPARDPMHISPNENIGVSLVSQLFEGSENYITWRKAMARVPGFKMKVGLIYGRFKKAEDPYGLESCEMCSIARVGYKFFYKFIKHMMRRTKPITTMYGVW